MFNNPILARLGIISQHPIAQLNEPHKPLINTELASHHEPSLHESSMSLVSNISMLNPQDV